ncbi:hypothetical protein MKW98_028454 [Papaver atlanticum]|uniref:Uncharacterized protein n=1 Tax=Papaver atlanticum TaxID=357466 RepID=A0AAD4TDQ9_9MAGN|nr:hypothetical protein MKW98_028454 [Papaver atlanticum]
MSHLNFHYFLPSSNASTTTLSTQSKTLFCSLNPVRSPSSTTRRNISISATPARDKIIDFGKHKGRMLGTLPSKYLKWVSKTLRARDFEEWAQLADQVLVDPVYKDRIEWELAEVLLNGNEISSGKNVIKSPVSDLLEISERFGWDNDDKIGWSKINFELLGTSKTGRIPRKAISYSDDDDEDSKGFREKKFGGFSDGSNVGGGSREERREKQRLKRVLELRKVKLDFVANKKKEIDQHQHQHCIDRYNDDDLMAAVEKPASSPFPGRANLLKKVMNRQKIL